MSLCVERSAGCFVVSTDATGTPRVLLISVAPGLFNVPKGHVEGTETLEDTALRETQEESGLDVSCVHIVGVVDTVTYRFRHKGRNIEKTVTMFLATLPWTDVRFGEREAKTLDAKFVSEHDLFETESTKLEVPKWKPAILKAFRMFSDLTAKK